MKKFFLNPFISIAAGALAVRVIRFAIHEGTMSLLTQLQQTLVPDLAAGPSVPSKQVGLVPSPEVLSTVSSGRIVTATSIGVA